MALQLLPLEDEDALIFYRIVDATDADDIFSRNFWLNGVTDAGHEHSAAGAIADMHEPDGPARLMKVVDPNLPDDDPMHKILSVALWKIYPTKRTPEQMQAAAEKQKARGVPPGANAAFLEDIFARFGAAQKEIIGDQAHVKLQMLFTRSDGFRRGAGRMHLVWGLEQADKLGLPAYLEASSMGRPLYERMGFQVVRDLPLDRERWNIRPEDTITCMLRPAQTKPGTTV